MITNYIQELLATNNRVIIPNYGAFLVRATSKGKDSNNLSEKLNDIYFSPFLKFNDELLERFIIKKDGVTKDQAAEKIKLFIEEVKTKLNVDSPFEIKNFGQFTIDKQGKVQFTPIAIEKSIALEKSADPSEVPTKEIKKSMPKPTNEAAKKPAAKTKNIKEPEKEIILDIPQEPESIKKDEATIEAKPEVKEILKPEIKQEIKTTTATPKPEFKHPSKKKESSINKGFVWSVAIGLPIAIIFIWALLNFDTIAKIIKKDQKPKPKTEKIVKSEPEKKVTDSSKPEETLVETTVVQPKEEKTIPVTNISAPNEKRYYIIAGSFKNEAYANSYLKGLQEKGFPAEKLQERNGMHAVSYSSYTDKSKALTEYKIITQEKGMNAWILYY